MANLILLLLGVDYLHKRARTLAITAWLLAMAGAVIFVDALDGVLYFPLNFFATLLVLEGLATLAVAHSGVGGQRVLRYSKGLFVLLAGGMILAGDHNGHFALSMIFGLLFLADGLLQCVSAYVVRYRRWRYSLVAGIVEIALAIFFFQPYPTHYVGTAPYCVGLFLIMSGIKLLAIARRVRHLRSNPAMAISENPGFAPATPGLPLQTTFTGPPADDEHALTVHIWTPTGSAKATTRHYPLIDRYIAAIDVNGVISTGHAALESPEGVYVSLYPAEEIDHSPTQFGTLLRATADNDVPGIFQPDYAMESAAWCPSNVKIRIRNYDPGKLQAFWTDYRRNATYNLTHRNCSSSVARALEAALEGAVGRLHGAEAGWLVMLRLLSTPELWVAAQIRKRALTMAWTPGLTWDYARALSMLADPRPFAWWSVCQAAMRQMADMRARWRRQDHQAHQPAPDHSANTHDA
jgi:uncharacterized membrane protein HdeD (DUF308 family)